MFSDHDETSRSIATVLLSAAFDQFLNVNFFYNDLIEVSTNMLGCRIIVPVKKSFILLKTLELLQICSCNNDS